MVFVAADTSTVSAAEARANLANVPDSNFQRTTLANVVDVIRSLSLSERVQFVHVEADALGAIQALRNCRPIDIAFHARLRHHLPLELREPFDEGLRATARTTIEFDDYQCRSSLVGPAITAWNRPVLLNGAIFSWARDEIMSELQKRHANSRLEFFPRVGSYTAISK